MRKQTSRARFDPRPLVVDSTLDDGTPSLALAPPRKRPLLVADIRVVGRHGGDLAREETAESRRRQSRWLGRLARSDQTGGAMRVGPRSRRAQELSEDVGPALQGGGSSLAADPAPLRRRQILQ